jgi:hypothetical protein
MDWSTHTTTRDSLQRVRALTSELLALTVAMSGYAQELRTGQQNGGPIGPVDAGKAEVMLGQIARTTTQLREEAARLHLEPEPVARVVTPGADAPQQPPERPPALLAMRPRAHRGRFRATA